MYLFICLGDIHAMSACFTLYYIPTCHYLTGGTWMQPYQMLHQAKVYASQITV